MTGARGRAVGRWAALGLAAILVIGCEQLDAAGVPVTPIHVVRETDALWVRAPAVASPEMLVVLC
ncbi:MAG TPA: hypothetical protein VM344_03865, partial [Vitreimonas sp.]|nr:hypothetical protein [Vitreimonas sp.]